MIVRRQIKELWFGWKSVADHIWKALLGQTGLFNENVNEERIEPELCYSGWHLSYSHREKYFKDNNNEFIYCN